MSATNFPPAFYQQVYQDNAINRQAVSHYAQNHALANAQCEAAFHQLKSHRDFNQGYIFSSGHPLLITSFIDHVLATISDCICWGPTTIKIIENHELAPALRSACYRGFVCDYIKNWPAAQTVFLDLKTALTFYNNHKTDRSFPDIFNLCGQGRKPKNHSLGQVMAKSGLTCKFTFNL